MIHHPNNLLCGGPLGGAMKNVLLLLMLLSSLVHAFSHGDHNPEEEKWTNDRDESEVQWFEPDPLQMMVKRLVRRPNHQQFFGLMGRRSSAKSQITRKRQKFQSFVGLMGKRRVAGSF